MQSVTRASGRRTTWLLAAIAIGLVGFMAQALPTSAQGTPTVQVSKTQVNPDGDTITVTGTGFVPSMAIGTRPPLAGQSGGVYIAFGAFADVWKPSEGAPGSTRPTTPIGEGGALIWAVPEAARAIVGQNASVTLNADGSFTATLTVTRDYDGALPNGNYGIYTYAGSGAVQPLFETYTPITFTGGAEPTAVATQPPATQPPATQPPATHTPAPPPTGDSALAATPSMHLLYVIIGGVVLLMGSSVLAVASNRPVRRR